MGKQLFPKEFLGASIEHYTFKIQPGSKVIYLVILGCLIAFICLLPFIRIDISKTALGQVTSIEGRYAISVPVSGRVSFSGFQENRFVLTGDTLLILDTSVLESELDYKLKEKEEIQVYLADLKALIAGSGKALMSDRYRRERNEHESTLRKLQIIYNNARKSFERQQLLYKAEVISELQYEEAKLPYDQASAEIDLFVERNRAKWELTITEYEEELSQLGNQLDQIRDELAKRYVTAPVSGSLQNVEITEAGQYVHSGIRVAELSPGDSLMVTCYVSPSDIGLLRVGQVCNMRVDAFNYNEWGMITGEIKEISRDVYIQDNRPFFQVRCSLEKRYLALQNGFTGDLKKGMTVQADFLIANRSLYQLLYDKVDDWVNPNVQSIASNTPAK